MLEQATREALEELGIDHVTAAALGVEQTAWVVPWNKEKKDSGQQRRIAAARNLFLFVMQEA